MPKRKTTDPAIAALVPVQPAPLASLATAGAAADAAAARGVFADYRSRKAARTRLAQDDDLARWAAYLKDAGAPGCEGWSERPECWQGVTWGLVEGFTRWQLQQGYAVGSINRALATIRTYAGLAARAGALDPQALTLICSVKGYATKEGRRLDAQREQTRKGHKKATHRTLDSDQIAALKAAPALDTPSGRRDRLMLCLFLDHGLRVGELAGLQGTSLDPKRGELRFYREKVSKEQTHKLTADTLRAALAYLPDAPPVGSLWRGSRKGGQLSAPGWSSASIRDRVQGYGAQIGVPDLSPHDLRHTWATRATRSGTHPFALKEAGGWSSLAMPERYTEAAKIANEGVQLGD